MVKVGDYATAMIMVTSKNTAKAVGSGSLDVFATPMMIALMEKAACECLADSLEPSQTSVGTQVNVAHIAASTLGETITATATVTDVDGRKITFTATANDGVKEIGSGTHERVVIDVEKFMKRLEQA